MDIYTLLRDGSIKKDEEILINVQNLKEGELYTYKRLCEILNQKRVGGNQKISQLKEFARFFDFEHDKEIKRYRIKKIYTVPLPPKLKSPANTKYADHIKVLLLSYLLKHKNESPGGVVYISLQRLYIALGIVNQQYLEMMRPDKKKKLKEEIKCDLDLKHYDVSALEDKTLNYYIRNFYYRCGSKFATIIKTVLDKLEKQNYIMHSRVYLLYKKYANEKEMVCKYSTDEEAADLLEIERKIMDEFGFDNEQDIWYGGRTDEYWARVIKEVQELYPEIQKMYKYHKIIGTKNNLLRALSKEEETEEMHCLNEKIIDFIDRQAENNMYKSIDDNPYNYDKQLSNRYVDAQKYLSNKLIKIKEEKEIKPNIIYMEDDPEWFK